METEMGARNVEFRDMFFTWDGDCCSICRVKNLGREKWGGLVILRGKPRLSSQTWTQLLPVLWGFSPRQSRAHGTETRNIELFLLVRYWWIPSRTQCHTPKQIQQRYEAISAGWPSKKPGIKTCYCQRQPVCPHPE
jgi:hypothetical protein